MRGVLVCFVAFAWFSAAAAQDAVPEDGLGPFHFGMSVEQTEAVSPHGAWREQPANGANRVLNGGPQLVLGGSRFGSSFVFNAHGLNWIVLTTDTPLTCDEAIPTFLAEVETTFGPFSSAPGPLEDSATFSRVSSITRTPGGSEIRTYTGVEGRHPIGSSRRAGMFIQVLGETPPSEPGCRVSVTFNPQTPNADQAAVTYDELDHAQTLINPVFTSQPTAESFARHYPRAALNASLNGHALLDCLINADGSLRCLVASETPANAGFGEAALHIAEDFRVMQNDAGIPAVGKRLSTPISFFVRD